MSGALGQCTSSPILLIAEDCQALATMTRNSPATDKVSLDEKKETPEEAVETVSSDASNNEVDFGGDSKLPPPPKLTPEQEKKLYRKVDLWLMPILTLMYLFSFLDRGNIGMYSCICASELL